MESLIIYNNRYAQNQQAPQSSFNYFGLAANPIQTGLQMSRAPINNVYNESQSNPALKSYQQSKDQIFQSLNEFNQKLNRSNPQIYRFYFNQILDFAVHFDDLSIWLIKNGLNLKMWYSFPWVNGLLKYGQKYPNAKINVFLQKAADIVLGRLSQLNVVKNGIQLVSAANTERFLESVGNNKGVSNLLSGEADDMTNLITKFLKNPKSLPINQQEEVIKYLGKTLSPEEFLKLNRAYNFNNVLKTGARLGENPDLYKKAAVGIFEGMEKVAPWTKDLAKNILKFIDPLISTVDFIDWMRVWNQKGWQGLSREEQTKLILSSLKALASICYFLPPPINAFAVLINTTISLGQTFGVEGAENLGYLAGGMGVGGAEKIKAIETISNAQIGTRPQTREVASFYDLIFGKLQNPALTALSNARANKKPLNPRELIKSVTGGNTRTFFENEIKKEINSMKSDLARKQYNWALNTNDTRYLELWNALSGSVKKLETYLIDEINYPAFQYGGYSADRKKQDEEAQKNLQNKRKFLEQTNYAGMGQEGKKIFDEASKIATSNIYNNRRYVTCPSI